MGAGKNEAIKLLFDRRLRLEFLRSEDNHGRGSAGGSRA
jgi:hypothetical protein